MPRTVYVVCTEHAYWPPEAWAIFADEAAALEHVERSVWRFRVEPIPVYANYAECPLEDRHTHSGPTGAMMRSRVRWPSSPAPNPPIHLPDAVRSRPLEERWTPWPNPRGDVVYAVCGHNSEIDKIVEVETLYSTEEAAREHVRDAHYMSIVLPRPLYATHDDCPPERRYDRAAGPQPWSQGMQLKDES
jgi:hypothetical protein